MALSSLLQGVVWMELNAAFGLALKRLRECRWLAHQRFFGATSRTYMSMLENGRRCPTLSKIEDLAVVLKVHPASLVIECYLQKNPAEDLDGLFERIRGDLAVNFSETDTEFSDSHDSVR